MPVTFDNIMWRGQLDGANEAVAKMDVAPTTLPLQIAVGGAFHSRAKHLRISPPPFFFFIVDVNIKQNLKLLSLSIYIR